MAWEDNKGDFLCDEGDYVGTVKALTFYVNKNNNPVCRIDLELSGEQPPFSSFCTLNQRSGVKAFNNFLNKATVLTEEKNEAFFAQDSVKEKLTKKAVGQHIGIRVKNEVGGDGIERSRAASFGLASDVNGSTVGKPAVAAVTDDDDFS